MSQFTMKPTQSVMMSTSPIANERMVTLLSHKFFLFESFASLKSKGAMNSTKKSSGSILISIGETARNAMMTPRPIWMSGSETLGTI